MSLTEVAAGISNEFLLQLGYTYTVEALDTSKTTVEIELFIHEAWLVYIHTATGGGDGQTRWAVNWLA